jgi:hypothetical protein
MVTVTGVSPTGFVLAQTGKTVDEATAGPHAVIVNTAATYAIRTTEPASGNRVMKAQSEVVVRLGREKGVATTVHE